MYDHMNNSIYNFLYVSVHILAGCCCSSVRASNTPSSVMTPSSTPILSSTAGCNRLHHRSMAWLYIRIATTSVPYHFRPWLNSVYA